MNATFCAQATPVRLQRKTQATPASRATTVTLYTTWSEPKEETATEVSTHYKRGGRKHSNKTRTQLQKLLGRSRQQQRSEPVSETALKSKGERTHKPLEKVVFFAPTSGEELGNW